jgi:radical SAM superfamily enzyme YgiQ (UPF0313 family)
MAPRRTVLLAQLPIPPLGPSPVRGNVPLAAAYLKLYAEARGLGDSYRIDILSSIEANTLGDRALAATIAERDPWLVGFTCYVWNIERTLWVARELKRLRPEVRIVLGGPEITADNAWVLEAAEYDFAAIGEGEQTFARLLLGLLGDALPPVPIDGLFVRAGQLPNFRTPMSDFNALGSPYLAGVLDAADEQMLLLETTRGCVFKCKFCYYPKAYDKQYYVGTDLIRASLRHAGERGAREVFLLDPTLNQRKDFADFLRLLAEGNPGGRFTYFGELRGEGITEATAALLKAANFSEVEVGLQSVGADAMSLMDRKNNLRAFERGVKAMMAEGIRVKVDLIIGLPGDTVESIRNGLRYLHERGFGEELQVFNLSILPGTDFRKEANTLGLKHQPRPPYYVLRTPTLGREDLFGLMREAQDLFDIEFDAQPAPILDFAAGDLSSVWRVHLDDDAVAPPEPRAQAFTLWLTAGRFDAHRQRAAEMVRRLLDDNPFTTLQVVLEPDVTEAGSVPVSLSPAFLEGLLAACLERPTYLDRFYGLQPGRPNGAKRLIVVLPAALRERTDPVWLEEVGGCATVVWRGEGPSEAELEEYEFAWMG